MNVIKRHCLYVGLLLVGLLAVEASNAYARFELQSAASVIVNEDGTPDVQAGSHPFAIETTIKFREKLNSNGVSITLEDLKDLQVKLPAGFVGDALALPKCTTEQFHTPNPQLAAEQSGASCPNDAQVGVARVELNTGGLPGPPGALYLGIYNLVPPPGVPAAFGFNPLGLAAVLTAKVRTGEDYGLNISTNDASQLVRVYGLTTTFWGVPYAHSHDGQRGACLGAEGEALGSCPIETAPRPLLRMPTSCSTPPFATIFYADSWQNPLASLETEGFQAEVSNHDTEGDPVGVSGCELLDFTPTVGVQPEVNASSPSSLNYELSLPQNENPEGLAESDLRNTILILPPGMAISPSAANGLGACTGTPETGRPGGQIALHSDEPVQCPNSSKIGTATIETPLLETPLEGSVYLARPNANEFNSLLAMYIVAEGDGVTIKLAGHIEADPATGQLTTIVPENPQQPFSHFRLHFFSGPRAALMTPHTCGAYTADSQLTPWSSPTQTPVSLGSSFAISSNCGGGFAPTLVAGTTSNQGGAFSPLVTSISRTDQDQTLSKITLTTPPGLLGMLSKVTPCPEPQAAAGTCPEASKIGHVTLSSGPAPMPLQLPEPGKGQDPVFLTGPYNGAPFGLTIVVPAEAGPFNLGNVVVRSTINVNPHTGQVTISSDPLPQVVNGSGILADVRSVNVIVDRDDFIFNPTSCQPSNVAGTITSAQNVSVALSSPFQAVNCGGLPFKPGFSAATQAKTSKPQGAALNVKVTSGAGQANIAKVKADLPLQLPARLTTLQQACVAAVFEVNPANCPAGSLVGTATAHTPVLSNPLSGPAYLVSHGGAAFPDLEIVLQGENVTLLLDGSTNIIKHITSSSFRTVPDAPITSFELALPEGPHSALAINLPSKDHGDLCGVSLKMPTALIGQNGATIKQSTVISVSGCPKIKKKAKTRRAKTRRKK
jgi:hypothetical protein